jgi:MFS family permease
LKNSHLVARYAIQQILHWMATGIIIPVMVLLQLAKGMSISQVGIITATYSALIIVLEIPTGSLADTIGRKRVYLISSALVTIARIILMAADSFFTILLAFSFYSVSRALNSGSLDAWFVDEHQRQFPDRDLQKPLALIEISVLAGLAISSLAGGILPDWIGVKSAHLFGDNPYIINVAAAALIISINVVYTSLAIHESRPAAQPDDREKPSRVVGNMITALKESISNTKILLLLISVIALGFGLSSLETFWQPRVQQISGQQTGSWVFGALSAGYFLSAAMGSLLVIPIAQRLRGSYHLLLAATRILFSLGILLLALQQHIGGFALFYILLFLFNGASSSPHQSLLNSLVSSKRRSTMLSVSSFALQAGGVAGALIGGFISERYSISAFWMISAAVLLFSSAAYLLLPRFGDS